MRNNINVTEGHLRSKGVEASRWYNMVKQELKFLWNDANDQEHPDDVRERKLKQYWELYRLYRKQKEFFMAVMES